MDKKHGTRFLYNPEGSVFYNIKHEVREYQIEVLANAGSHIYGGFDVILLPNGKCCVAAGSEAVLRSDTGHDYEFLRGLHGCISVLKKESGDNP